MNTLTIMLLLSIAAIALYEASPMIARWWNTRRPTQCPACRAWKPVQDMTYVRHNSGAHVRICEKCYRHLYAPFTQDHEHDPKTTA